MDEHERHVLIIRLPGVNALPRFLELLTQSQPRSEHVGSQAGVSRVTESFMEDMRRLVELGFSRLAAAAQNASTLQPTTASSVTPSAENTPSSSQATTSTSAADTQASSRVVTSADDDLEESKADEEEPTCDRRYTAAEKGKAADRP